MKYEWKPGARLYVKNKKGKPTGCLRVYLNVLKVKTTGCLVKLDLFQIDGNCQQYCTFV
jgi:hypothetical protein